MSSDVYLTAAVGSVLATVLYLIMVLSRFEVAILIALAILIVEVRRHG